MINAGHLPAIRIHESGEMGQIAPQRVPLGIVPQTLYTETTVSLRNASLYLFSDGLTEATVKGEHIGLDGLVTLLHSLGQEPATLRLQAVMERLTRDADLLRDDITLLVLQP